MNDTERKEMYQKSSAAILCIAALLLSGCYYPLQCAVILGIFGVLSFFTRLYISKPGIVCAAVCFAGFLLSDCMAGALSQAPVAMMKYTFLFFPVFFTEEAVKKSMLFGLYIGTVLLSLLGLAGRVFPAFPVGTASLIEYENTMAVFACAGAAIALFYAVVKREHRFLHGLAFFVCIIAAIIANSIFLYFCVLAAGAVVLCLRFRRAWYFVAAAVVAVVGGILWLFMSGRADMVLTSTVASRLIYWQDALRLVAAHPFGIGVDGWVSAQYTCQSAIYSVKYVHNSILQLLLDGGILAAGGYLVFILFGTVKTLQRYRKDRKPQWLLLIFLILTLFLHALFDFDQAYGGYLLVLGVCVSFALCENDKKERTAKYSGIIAALVLCGLSIFGGCTAYLIPEKPPAVMTLTEEYRTAYDTGDYVRAYDIAVQLLDAAPRQQASYDAAYLSIDKLHQIGYSNKYRDMIKELQERVAQVNRSMNPLVRYLDRHKQIVLPISEGD